MHTLGQLHSELAGKLLDDATQRKRLTTAMLQVEAVMKLWSVGSLCGGGSRTPGSSGVPYSGAPWMP
jgi:hypothetical protein